MKLATGVLMSALLLLLSACMGSDPDPTATAPPPATATSAETPAAPPSPTPTEAAPTPTAPEPTSTSAPTATATTPAETPTPEDPEGALEAELNVVAAITSDIRGLDYLEDVPISIVTQEELQSYLLELREEEYSAEDSQRDAQLLWLLRLVDDPNLDIHQLYNELLAASIGGLYDPEKREIIALGEGEGEGLTPLSAMIMAHEYTHALQDQHYNLLEIRSEDMDSEAQFAALALTEGDAEVVRTLYMINHLTPQQLQAILNDPLLESDIPENMPAYLVEINVFPYLSGAEFAVYLYQQGGFAAVDAAYADPPRSTEQILHPEKYYGPERDDPVEVSLPELSAALGDGWSELENDVIGELDLRVLLRENGVAAYEQAAAGWGGGRYAFYASDTAGIVINRVAWDTDEDRQEFDEAFHETLADAQESGGIYDDGLGRYHALVELEGTTVFITATDRAAVERVLAALVG